MTDDNKKTDSNPVAEPTAANPQAPESGLQRRDLLRNVGIGSVAAGLGSATYLKGLDLSRLRALAQGQSNLRVERFTPDLHQKLAGCELSISMGGYNTTMNVLATGVRAMMLGCANNGGMDQVERVEKLGQLGVVDVIRPDDLEPGRFADKIARCLERAPAVASIDLDGVGTTASLLQKLIRSPGNTQQNTGKHRCLA